MERREISKNLRERIREVYVIKTKNKVEVMGKVFGRPKERDKSVR